MRRSKRPLFVSANVVQCWADSLIIAAAKHYQLVADNANTEGEIDGMIAKTHGLFTSAGFLVGLVQAVLWVVLGVGLVNLTSSFIQMFEDFDMDLPGSTIAVINLTGFLKCCWYLALLPVCLWPLVNFGVVSVLSRTFAHVPIVKWLWYGLTWSIPLLIVGIAIAALFLPFLTIDGRLS